MNRTGKIIANVKVNGQRHTRDIVLHYNEYREEALRRWTAHINSLPEDDPSREAEVPEVTHEEFDEAVHRVAFQVSQEPMPIATGTKGREVYIVVAHPDYVEVVIHNDSGLVLPS